MPNRPADKAPQQQPAEGPEVAFTPAPALEDAVNTAEQEAPIEHPADGSLSPLLSTLADQENDVATKAKTPDEGAHETDAARYRVLSGGISAPSGRPVATFWKGDIATGEELGGADRVAKLLARKAIEIVND